MLKIIVDENEKINKIKELDFDEKKVYITNLINNTNTDEELNEIISKIHNHDDNNDLYLLENFKDFKLFLEKNIMFKCEIIMLKKLIK